MERLREHSIVTYTGGRVWPLDPRPEEINILDIAHALSNNSRFTGHTKKFYSVAQHSVLVSMAVPPELALCGLLHDASEAYLSDIASPVKMQMPFYKEAELRLERVIAEVFKLPYPFPPEIKAADIQLRVTESRDLMPPTTVISKVHGGGTEPLPFTIFPLSPETAKVAFMDRYRELTGPVPAQYRQCSDGFCGIEQDLAIASTIRIAQDFANREVI